MASASGGPPPSGDQGITPKTTNNNKNNENSNKGAAAAAIGGDKDKDKGKKYADITKKKGDTWLTLSMFRENSSISYNLSKKERADLLLNSLKNPKKNV